MWTKVLRGLLVHFFFWMQTLEITMKTRFIVNICHVGHHLLINFVKNALGGIFVPSLFLVEVLEILIRCIIVYYEVITRFCEIRKLTMMKKCTK